MANNSGKKYLKGKDGKFNGSLPESPNLGVQVELPKLPTVPSEAEVSDNADSTAIADSPVIEDTALTASAASDVVSSEAEAVAFEAGVKKGIELERAHIIEFLESEVAKLDAMRPEWYKTVADKADARIRTIRAVIKKIQELE